MSLKTISGVCINLDAADVKKAKNLKQLKKLNIFEHLDDEQKAAAETELATELGIVGDAPDTVE